MTRSIENAPANRLLRIGRTAPMIGVATLGLLALAGVLSGCNIIGPASYIVSGPAKVPAAYTLNPELTTVVFIDDPVSVLPSRDARLAVGQACEEQLLNEKYVKDMIQSRQVLQHLRGEKRTEPVSIANVGKALGAKVVIYALVTRFGLSSDGQSYSPTASMEVKVISAETGERLFPGPDAPRDSLTIELTESGRPEFSTKSRGELAQLEVAFAKRLGVRLAKVFYEWVPETQVDRREEGR
ncbi:MAG: hypothetical protein IBJ18_00060 [Phycisphaerales bacterium]|nr:hypothetical protein [Phycisphaerales bacterium]